MTRIFKGLLRLAITLTERALRTEARPRCIRGASLAARAARYRELGRALEHPEPGSPAPVGVAKP